MNVRFHFWLKYHAAKSSIFFCWFDISWADDKTKARFQKKIIREWDRCFHTYLKTLLYLRQAIAFWCHVYFWERHVEMQIAIMITSGPNVHREVPVKLLRVSHEFEQKTRIRAFSCEIGACCDAFENLWNKGGVRRKSDEMGKCRMF